jgi:hypothetical protein
MSTGWTSRRSLGTSIEVDPEGADSQTRKDETRPAHALGWSGDGSFGGGSLREFAIGAVIQHFPKTLNRIEDQDFRLPTNAELDALEAYQLSLGRKHDLDLAKLEFRDPNVEAGICSTARASSVRARRLVDPSLTCDGGFDREPVFARAELPGLECHGNAMMNVPPVVEAADTLPLFHNHSAPTVEAAIRFYTTDLFDPDPSDGLGPFELTDNRINQIAVFMRAINARENIRSALAQANDARWKARNLGDFRERVLLVVAETEDALQVLTEGPPEQDLLPLMPKVVRYWEKALDRAEWALGNQAPLETKRRVGQS